MDHGEDQQDGAPRRVLSRGGGWEVAVFWMCLGVAMAGLMDSNSILMLPISQGVQGVTLFSDASHLVGAPCERPLCPQSGWFQSPCPSIHHSAAVGWTEPSLLQVSCAWGKGGRGGKWVWSPCPAFPSDAVGSRRTQGPR